MPAASGRPQELHRPASATVAISRDPPVRVSESTVGRSDSTRSGQADTQAPQVEQWAGSNASTSRDGPASRLVSAPVGQARAQRSQPEHRPAATVISPSGATGDSTRRPGVTMAGGTSAPRAHREA